MSRPVEAAPCRGFTYLGVMFIVSLLSLTASMASVVWSTVQQRENERELAFAGRQYQAAIERYQQHSKTPARRFPRQLTDLLRDARDPAVRRDLRQLYPDPMTGRVQWGLIRLPDGGIVGVHSLSDRRPLQRSLISPGVAFPKAVSYRDWRFIAPSGVDALAAALIEPQLVLMKPAPLAKPGAVPGVPEGSPAVEPEVLPSVSIPRPSMRDYRERTPEACGRIVAHDQLLCEAQGRTFGDDEARDCEESAVARSAACLLGPDTPLPDLVLRAN
ncbi:MAG: type II secretion system GspH family protein [Burkholderiaceae bacterium]|nr:type II secretion system GspH family protein [Burkholderiaceae bacterium]